MSLSRDSSSISAGDPINGTLIRAANHPVGIFIASYRNEMVSHLIKSTSPRARARAPPNRRLLFFRVLARYPRSLLLRQLLRRYHTRAAVLSISLAKVGDSDFAS